MYRVSKCVKSGYPHLGWLVLSKVWTRGGGKKSQNFSEHHIWKPHLEKRRARERHRLIHTLAGLASPLFVEQWKEIVQNHLQQQQIQADHARPHFKEKEEEETSSRERKREKLISKPDSSFKLEARRKKGRSEEVDQSVWSGGGRAAHKFPL